MKEQDYINVGHLQHLRAMQAVLQDITPALLPSDEDREALVLIHRNTYKLIESLRKHIRIDIEKGD